MTQKRIKPFPPPGVAYHVFDPRKMTAAEIAARLLALQAAERKRKKR